MRANVSKFIPSGMNFTPILLSMCAIAFYVNMCLRDRKKKISDREPNLLAVSNGITSLTSQLPYV